MKKLLIAIAIVLLFAFNQEKKMKVELSEQQWQGVLFAIDNSTLPHNDVKTIQGWIVPQLRQQLDSTKQKPKQ